MLIEETLSKACDDENTGQVEDSTRVSSQHRAQSSLGGPWGLAPAVTVGESLTFPCSFPPVSVDLNAYHSEEP